MYCNKYSIKKQQQPTSLDDRNRGIEATSYEEVRGTKPVTSNHVVVVVVVVTSYWKYE